MARKRLTKKANKATTTKVKRRAKATSLTVAEVLKQLPKLLQKELTASKKQIKKLTLAIKSTEKQKNKAQLVLAKPSTTNKALAAAKKVYKQSSQMIIQLTNQLETANYTAASLSHKQAALITLNKPVAKKAIAKPTKTKSSSKKSVKPLTATASAYEEIQSIASEPAATSSTISTSEPETELTS